MWGNGWSNPDPWSSSRVGGPRRRKKNASGCSNCRSKKTRRKTRRRSKRSKSRSISPKRKAGRLTKGSAAAKAWGRKMRALRRG